MLTDCVWCSGACIKNALDDYVCRCLDGFNGVDCRYSTEGCSGHPCLNAGVCRPSLHGAHLSRCICPEGYSGPRCERRNACASAPCLNGGHCVVVGSLAARLAAMTVKQRKWEIEFRKWLRKRKVAKTARVKNLANEVDISTTSTRRQKRAPRRPPPGRRGRNRPAAAATRSKPRGRPRGRPTPKGKLGGRGPVKGRGRAKGGRGRAPGRGKARNNRPGRQFRKGKPGGRGPAKLRGRAKGGLGRVPGPGKARGHQPGRPFLKGKLGRQRPAKPPGRAKGGRGRAPGPGKARGRRPGRPFRKGKPGGRSPAKPPGRAKGGRGRPPNRRISRPGSRGRAKPKSGFKGNGRSRVIGRPRARMPSKGRGRGRVRRPGRQRNRALKQVPPVKPRDRNENWRRQPVARRREGSDRRLISHKKPHTRHRRPPPSRPDRMRGQNERRFPTDRRRPLGRQRVPTSRRTYHSPRYRGGTRLGLAGSDRRRSKVTLHGGYVRSRIKTYQCACVGGFWGAFCQFPPDYKACASNPCGPGKICTDIHDKHGGYACKYSECMLNATGVVSRDP